MRKKILFGFLVFISSLMIFVSCDYLFGNDTDLNQNNGSGKVSGDSDNSGTTIVNNEAVYYHDSTYHWEEGGVKQKHIWYESYELDSENECILKECSLCHYRENINNIHTVALNNPGKTMYTLTVYDPETDDYDPKNKTGNFEISAKSGSVFLNSVENRSLSCPDVEYTVRATDDWTLVGNYATTVSLWFTNETSKVKVYVDESLLDDDLGYKNSGQFNKSTEASTFWNNYKNLLNTELNKNFLSSERSIFDLDLWDIDEDGYFRIVLVDFGESNVVVTQNGVSGIGGVYMTGNTYPKELYALSNHSDMFYINARFVIACFYYLNYDVQKCLKSSVMTLCHEYMHYLHDSCYKKSGDNTAGLVYSSTFFVEGIANAASYLTLGSEYETPNSDGHMKTFLINCSAFYPDPKGPESLNPGLAPCNYAIGPVYFLFLKNRYGIDLLNSFIKTDTIEINEATLEVYKHTFMNLYTDMLRTVFAESHKQSSDYYKCGLTDSRIQETAKVIKADTGYSYSESDIHQLSFVLNKWQVIPSMINVSGSGFRTFIFFL